MDSHDRVVTGIGSPNSGCDVHAALANERDHITALRRRDSDADKVNPLGLPIGLALSGGGIRSATVCLGAVQALAESRLLRRFDYLSTVSGGGYIGCWLSAILRGHGRTLPAGEAIGAVEELIAPSEIRKKDEEPAEIAFLRAYSNYLTPRLGLFSSDTLAALTGYLRNLFLSLLLAVFSVGSLLTSQVAAECSLSRPAASHFGLAAGVDRSSVTEFSRSIRAHSAHRCRSPCRSRDHS